LPPLFSAASLSLSTGGSPPPFSSPWRSCFFFFRDPDAPFRPILTLSSLLPMAELSSSPTKKRLAGRHAYQHLPRDLERPVNRTPALRHISKVDYRPGKFLAAWNAKASTQNEQNIFTLATPGGDIEFKQSRV